MPWARFADDYLGNSKLATLSTSAIALDMAGIIYSARELRDGLLSTSDVVAIAALIHLGRWKPVADELVDARRWAVLTPGGGWEIHDYLEYQPSREKVLAERSAARDRKRSVRGDVRPDTTRIPDDVRPDSGFLQSTPYPVPVNSVSGNLTPAGSGSSLAARDHAREADPNLIAQHLELIAAERASHAKPSQPSQNSSETNGKSNGAGR